MEEWSFFPPPPLSPSGGDGRCPMNDEGGVFFPFFFSGGVSVVKWQVFVLIETDREGQLRGVSESEWASIK